MWHVIKATSRFDQFFLHFFVQYPAQEQNLTFVPSAVPEILGVPKFEK